MMHRALAAAFLLLVTLVPALRAQSTSASVGGRLTDPQGALVADARVAAIGAGTNVRHVTTTNDSGQYHLTNLPPGEYRIEVEKSGFKKLIKPSVFLHVQDALEIDLMMTLGSVAESVTVEAGAPLVNTESGTVSTVIDRTFVENLPLNGRSFQTLVALSPGVVLSATKFDDQGQFSVNGQRADANYFTVDGVSANFGVTGLLQMVQTATGALPALNVSGGTNSLVSVDAMQEFRIQTSSFAPEFGRTPGGQIAIATRSGTNEFHGTVFEYFRNSALDARDWFVNLNRLPKPEQRMNDFGAVFGGPLRANRTFFFASYEGLRLRQPQAQQSAVPDAASRLQAPESMRPYLNAYPVPNGPSLGGGLAQFNASYSNPSTLDTYSLRVDHVLSPKMTVFVRYNYSPSRLEQRSPPQAGPVLSTTNFLSSTLHTATGGLTHLLKSGISNEVRVNYSNQKVVSRFSMDDFGGATPPPDSLLFPSGHTSEDALFGFFIPGAGQYNQGKVSTGEQRQVNVIDNVSVSAGHHQLKFGVDYRWLAPFSSPYAYRQFVQFTGVTAAPGGALSGSSQVAGTFALETNALLSTNFSLYGQDTWKVLPRLTVTYGLRWDVNPAPRGKNDANDPFTVTGLDDPATIALAPPGTPLYETTWGNVAPRLGVAYQLREGNWGSVVRAGGGVFYDLGSGSLGGATTFFPHISSKVMPAAPFPLSPQDAAGPPLSTVPPVTTMFVADPHLKLPRSYQWNVALEQSLGRSQSLSLTYVGAVGRDLLRATTLFNPNPDFQSLVRTDNSATSDYHALQVKFQRRLSRGLQALASYTWSHSIDIASTDASSARGTPGITASPEIDRGDSAFDIRHAFSGGATCDLPSPASRSARAILGGWSLDGFVYARSAPAVDVIGSTVSARGVVLTPRPNLNPGVPIEVFGDQYPGGKIYDRAAFSAATPGQQGDFGRNVLRGFGAWQADMALQRRFRFGQSMGLLFRAEFFNVFNHPSFGSPNNTFTSPLFGRSTQTLANSLGAGGANGGFNPLYQIGGPRSIQLALKLQF